MKIRTAILLILTLFTFNFSFAKTKEMARVSHFSINSDEAELAVKQMGGNNFEALPTESQKAILTRLLYDKILEAKEKKEGIEKQPETQLQIRSLLVSKLINQNSGDIEVEAKQKYESSALELKGKKTYTLSHILLKDETGAKKLKGEILGAKKAWKEKFKELAKTNSIDTPSAKNHGFVGAIPEIKLSPDLLKPIQNMKTNLLYGPIYSPLGWHLIVVEKIEEMQVPPFPQVKQVFISQIINEKINETAKKETGNKTIEFKL
jgi:parvulin-like peptidyl-prolyl isomerase